ncbi:MAG: pyridoxamine 5'-phosphate oxidase family protein [Spirochaetia bacterium]
MSERGYLTSRTELLNFMRTHTYAVQASVSPVGAAQAAVINIAVTDSLEIIFDTVDTTRKVKNLLVNPRIALVIGGWMPGDERTVQYEGVVDKPQGPELERLMNIYYARFPEGRRRLSWAGITYLRVRPTWIRYRDFNKVPATILELDTEQIQTLK